MNEFTVTITLAEQIVELNVFLVIIIKTEKFFSVIPLYCKIQIVQSFINIEERTLLNTKKLC